MKALIFDEPNRPVVTQGSSQAALGCHSAPGRNRPRYARPEGCVSMVGINIGQKVSVELGKIQKRDLSVKGCIGSPGVWPDAIRFLERTGIDLSPVQTHHFALDDALDAVEPGKDPHTAVKVTLDIT